MRNLKKVLALVIAFSMMLSVVAFAGYNDVDADADYASAVELLSALNIFKGDENGNFNPDNTITRAEMAAIICRAKGLEGQATGSAGATMFADVAADHWASGYINLASQNGIINGYGDGNFGPDDTVTYEQAIKMLVCTLGYEPMAQAKGGWSTGYLVVANTYKLTEGAAANATRANLAILVANALEAPMMDQTSYGADEKFERLDGKGGRDFRSLLTDMDIYIITGSVATNVDKTYVTVTLAEESEDDEFNYNYVGGVAQTTTKKVYVGTTDVAAYEHQIVDIYVKKNARKEYTALAVTDANVGQTVSIVSDDIDAINAAATEVKYFVDPANSDDKDDITIALDTIEQNKVNLFTAPVVAGVATPATKAQIDAILDATLPAGYDSDLMLTFIDVDGDDVYTKLIITKYDSWKVESVEADKDKIGFNSRIFTLDFEDDKKTIIIRDMAGNELGLADFAEDDMIAVCADNSNIRLANYVEIVKLDDAAVTGKVESTWTSAGSPYVSINGNEYVNASGRTIASGDEGTYYIGMTGKIVDWEATSAAGNYGVVLEAGISTAAFGSTWQIKILTADGVVTYEVDDDLATYDDPGDATAPAGSHALAEVTDTTPEFEEYLATLDGYVAATATTNAAVNWVRASADTNRLVEFDTDSKGLIDELAVANGVSTPIAANSEYSENSQKIDGKTLEDDIVIFYLDKANADDVFVTDLAYLVDEAEYAGYTFKDAIDRENCVMVVTAGQSPFNAETGFAVVTRVAKGQDAEGDEIYTVNYVQAEEEGVITFTDDSEDAYSAAKTYKTLDIGDVILFNADGEGVVTNYAVVATYGTNFALNASAVADYAADNFGDDARIHTGYLYHFEKGAKVSTAHIANGTTVAVATAATDVTAYELPSAAYKYTYNNVNARNIKIDAGEYLNTENTEYWTRRDSTDRAVATPVLFVEIDGSIVDIISANDAVAVSFVDVPAITQ